MTYEEVFGFAFKEGFIPGMKTLKKKIGEEKFIEMLKEAFSEVAAQQMQERARDIPVKNPSTFLAPVKQDNRFFKHALTFEIVEDTEKASEIKVTECLFAKTFREMDAADIGYACVCCPDYASARAFNPKMKMIRTKTLMQGHDCCNHRWVLEG